MRGGFIRNIAGVILNVFNFLCFWLYLPSGNWALYDNLVVITHLLARTTTNRGWGYLLNGELRWDLQRVLHFRNCNLQVDPLYHVLLIHDVAFLPDVPSTLAQLIVWYVNFLCPWLHYSIILIVLRKLMWDFRKRVCGSYWDQLQILGGKFLLSSLNVILKGAAEWVTSAGIFIAQDTVPHVKYI